MSRRFLLLVLASVAAVQAQGNSKCAHWCKDNFPNPGSVCTSLAAQGGGPCYECGPLKTVPTKQLCSGVCTDTATDPKNCGSCGRVVDTFNDDANCGACGHACSSTEFCSSGVCTPKVVPCNNPFSCGGPPTYCGTGPPGSLCVCFGSNGGVGPGTGCLDVTQLGGCPPTQCTDNASCGPGKVCIASCCGKTCATVQAACPGAALPSRMFRRGPTLEELVASSPYLNNATIAE